MKYLARLLALMGLCASAAVAKAAIIEEFNVMGWIVGAYSDNRTGQFTHCATSIPYRSGTTLFFHLGSNYMWSMGLHNPQWRNTPGSSVDLIYYIDNGPQTRVRALVTTLGLVNIPLADSRGLFEAFKRGRRLFVVEFQGEVRLRSHQLVQGPDRGLRLRSAPLFRSEPARPWTGAAPAPAPAQPVARLGQRRVRVQSLGTWRGRRSAADSPPGLPLPDRATSTREATCAWCPWPWLVGSNHGPPDPQSGKYWFLPTVVRLSEVRPL